MDERIYLKVKVKSLADEARIIRLETKRARSLSIKNGLYRHRIDVVRFEARHTHLAYGFLRGKSYEQIEQKAHVAPNWAKVRKMVEKYGTHMAPWALNSESYGDYKIRAEENKKQLAEVLQRFDEWVERAKLVSSS